MKIKLLRTLSVIALMYQPLVATDLDDDNLFHGVISDREMDDSSEGVSPLLITKCIGYGAYKEELYQENMIDLLDAFAQRFPKKLLGKVYGLYNRDKLEELTAHKKKSEELLIQSTSLENKIRAWKETIKNARVSGSKKRNKSRKISHASTMIKELGKQLKELTVNNLETIIVAHFNECLCVGYLRRYSIGDQGMIDLPWDSYDTMKDRVVSYVSSKYLQNPPEGLERALVEYEYDYDFMGNDPKIVKELNAIALREIIPSPYGEKMQNCTLHMFIKKGVVHIKEDKPFQNLPILETAVIWQNPSFVDQ